MSEFKQLFRSDPENDLDTDIEVAKYDQAAALRAMGIEPFPMPKSGMGSLAAPPKNEADQYFFSLNDVLAKGADMLQETDKAVTAGVRQGGQEAINSVVDFLGKQSEQFATSFGVPPEYTAATRPESYLQELNNRGFNTELPLSSYQPETEVGISLRELTAFFTSFLLGRGSGKKDMAEGVLDRVGNWGHELVRNVRGGIMGEHALNVEESNLSQLAVDLGFTQELNDYFAEGSTADTMAESLSETITQTANPEIRDRGNLISAEARLQRKVDSVTEGNAVGALLTGAIMTAAKASKIAAKAPKTTAAAGAALAMQPEDAESLPLDDIGKGVKSFFKLGDNINQEDAQRQIFKFAEERAAGSGKPPKATVADIHNYLDQVAIQKYGRPLNIVDNPKDYETVKAELIDDIKYQSEKDVSGAGWYDSDVLKTYNMISRIPGFEDLASNEDERVIFSAILGATSPGPKVAQNTRAGAAQYLQWKQTGKFSTEAPPPGTAVAGVEKAGFGQYGYPDGLKMIQYLLDKFGPEKFADWWLSPHSRAELTQLRKEAGFKSGPAGIKGKAGDMHFGAAILGDKAGKFSLNINGYQATTKDKWFVRTIRRAEGTFGETIQSNGVELGQPRNVSERAVMDKMINEIVNDPALASLGLSEQDAQAILWFREQNLYTDLGVKSVPQTFSEGVENLSGQAGFGIRASDEVKAQIEQGTAELPGYRSVSKGQRAVRADRRRQLAILNNPEGDGASSGPYGGISEEDVGGIRRLEPDETTAARYEKAGLHIPGIDRVDATGAAQYNQDMTAAMQTHEYGAQVEIKSAEELAQANLFRIDGGGGFAIKDDGDIVAVFQPGDSKRGGIYAVLQAAVAMGGKKLDAFDTMLPHIYETAGFRPVSRLKWNDEFAPENWNKETFQQWNNGEPDIVFFVYDENYFGGIDYGSLPRFDDYDQAAAAQDTALKQITTGKQQLELDL